MKGGSFALWVLRKSCRTEHPLNFKAQKISAVYPFPPEAHGDDGRVELGGEAAMGFGTDCNLGVSGILDSLSSFRER